MLADERTARYKSADEAEAKARAVKKNEDEIARLMAAALKGHAPRIQSLERAIAEVKGFRSLVAGNRVAAKAEFDKLKDTTELHRDQLAEIYVAIGRRCRSREIGSAPWRRNSPAKSIRWPR